ncbi:recombinase family protein [Roseivivax sediminis]|uniref:recombinase family protein n=1 Tax=Roseivivax sediminis TaxID=936889 RepID=UPI001CB72A14|nr:recombinase family protein [Roseivivax sediminis]
MGAGLAQIHAILTCTTYIGEHRFNTRSHKNREKKPESEVAIMAVPPLIEREIYDVVQARLKSRNPMVTPARVSSGPTLLTGICFCAKCGGAMTLRTGQGSTGAIRSHSIVQATRASALTCSRRSPVRPVSAYGSTMAVTGAIICAPWCSASRSRTTRFASWDRSRNCCEHWSPLRA